VISSRPKLVSLQPRRLADVWSDIERVGEALNVATEPVIKAIEERIATITRTIGKESDRPTVLVLEWIEPLMGAGGWIPELVALAGGIPVLAEIGGPCPYLQWEDLREADPDIIALAPCGFDLARTEQEAKVSRSRPEWSELKAVRSGRIFITDGNAYFNRPGPRLVDSLEILAEIIHPERFAPNYRGKGWITSIG
jgi:iron complex transport system substrate-binding protein